MGNESRYTLVGLFVLLFGAGALGFAWWLANHGGQQEYDHYQVLMNESVAGLSTDAAVKYRGVDVGTVTKIELNPDNPEQVRLVLRIERGTPIKTDTKATLSFYGITGLAFIELKGSSRDAPRLQAKAGEMPTIPSAPSAITRLDDALSELAVKSSRALDRIDRLLSDENLANVGTLIRDARDMVHGLRDLGDGLSRQLADLGELVDKGIAMEQQVASAFVDVTRASLDVERLSKALRKTYVALGRQADRLLDQGNDLLHDLYGDLESLLGQLQLTVERLGDHPADLLFSRSTPQPGPGEARP